MKGAILLIAVPVALGWAVPAAEAPEPLTDRLGRRRTGNVDNFVASHISLQRLPGQSQPQPLRYWTHSRASSFSDNGGNFAADANSTMLSNLTIVQNNNYVGTITLGKEKLQVIIDTGSADTWVIQKNYTCLDADRSGSFRQVPTAVCAFGPPYNGTFQYGTIPDTARYSVAYVDGSQVAGQVGYQDITIAGLTVKKQETILIDTVAYIGNDLTSGILGLAYPIVGRVFSKNATASTSYPDSPNHRKYDPIFTSMYKQGLAPPVFSVAMDKKTQSGYLAFGGLPPVDVSPDFGKTPIRIVEADGAPALKKELSFYTIVPDGFVVGSQDTTSSVYSNPAWNASHYPDVKTSQFPVVVDTGTTMTVLPTGLVRAYAQQIPGGFTQQQGYYWALCNATLPRFGVIIGGKTFDFRGEDLMLQDVQGTIRQGGRVYAFCQLGIVDIIPNGPYILGETFLNSVVTVFDVGASEIRLYPWKR